MCTSTGQILQLAGLIRCLAERTWRIVTDQKERQDELDKLKTNLALNEYPANVIEKSMALFLEKKAREGSPVATVEKMKRFLKLPCVSRKCEDYVYRLKNLVESNYPQVEFNVAFHTPMNFGRMFPFKDS